MAIQAGEDTFYQANRGIVQDGLVLNLDAGVKDSYNGGTTWRDLAGSNNGTLTNGPTFSKDNGGVLEFDGTNQNVNCGTISSLHGSSGVSICAWVVRHTTGNYPKIVSQTHGGTFDTLFSNLNTIHFYTPAGLVSAYYGGFLLNKWHFTCFTYQAQDAVRIYADGQLMQETTTTSTNTVTSNANITIANNSSMPRPLDGAVSAVQLYSRALTAAEVLQNYNVTRHRFGV